MLELMAVIAIMMVLLGLLIPTIFSIRGMANSASCVSKLKQITVAFHQYAMENNAFPDPYQNKVSWEASLRPVIAANGLFVCPADHEVAPAVGAS